MSEEKSKLAIEEVKFLPNGADDATKGGDVEKGAKRAVNNGAFVGLTKEELQQFADDPYWVRTRKILFILFWILWVGMVAAAVIIIVLSPKCPPRPDQKWWETSVLYRVDVRTFKDSDGDGIGDLAGVTGSVEYVADLVGSGGAVLLSTIFQNNGQDDLRRDVTNFKAVDGEIGNLENLQQLVKSFHKKGVKVVLEIDPNHSSKEHPFFLSSQKKEKAYENYYVWAAAKPNDWKSVSDPTKDAWVNDATRNEFYYSAHGGVLADLNLKDEAVQKEIIAGLDFWLREEGIDGFLVSGAEYFVEDAGNAFQPESAEVIQAFRTAFDQVGADTGKDRALIVSLSGDGNATQRSLFYGTQQKGGANIVVNDRLADVLVGGACADSKSACVAKSVADSNRIVEESHQKCHNDDRPWANWALSSLNTGRLASKVDAKFIDAYNLILLTLRGTPLVLYGDEIGMSNAAGKEKTRSVMQWDSDAVGGFTAAEKAKFPVNADVGTVNVKFQLAKGHDASHLLAFKSFAGLRKANAFAYGTQKVYSAANGLFSFSRIADGHPGYFVAVNLGDRPITAPGLDYAVEEGISEIVATTSGTDFEIGTKLELAQHQHLLLQPGVGVVLKLGRQ